MKIDPHHIGNAERESIRRARSFKELSQVALAIMAQQPSQLHMVSGPMSSGGENVTANLRLFKSTIDALVLAESLSVFSQIPYMDRLIDLHCIWQHDHPKGIYCQQLLDEFYEPILSSGKIIRLHFIRGWRSSIGARWEHDNCDRWKIERRFLPHSYAEQMMAHS